MAVRDFAAETDCSRHMAQQPRWHYHQGYGRKSRSDFEKKIAKRHGKFTAPFDDLTVAVFLKDIAQTSDLHQSTKPNRASLENIAKWGQISIVDPCSAPT